MNSVVQSSAYFGFFITLFGYWISSQIAKKAKSTLCNPLLLTIIFIIVFLKLTGTQYASYETGVKYINYFLTPSTVCLAVPLYRQMKLLKEYAGAILISIISGTVACAIMIFAMSRLFALDTSIYASLVPKSITTAIALGMSEELGGIAAVTVMAVFITGILGAVIATTVFKIFHIEDPVAQGLALGTASHAIGTSKALELGEIQAAMSSLAIAVTGILTVIVGPIVAGFY
ncbi:MAG: LrgB family protein [Lachnospiraceae bacterium]|uniref:LrgB family protein n=1 Tax=Hominiventricola filiformis TaxID=2885352 RepID=A0AAE3A476_9FIRM|nr:LrgB family protein [Hominiventricola filiformis]MCC2124602.1 LrgB family protein [Hominiventricola filiformis]MCI6879355.1 LrgB family protein [Clostridiaceae bacterium]MDY3826321.1 LrgB family protein [Lachnospiraceae bacterium]QUO22142.1 LrgB family protein [Clostridiaceae bacterium Marseille-Q4143]